MANPSTADTNLPTLPAGYHLDNSSLPPSPIPSNESSELPPLPSGYSLAPPVPSNESSELPPLPSGYSLDKPAASGDFLKPPTSDTGIGPAPKPSIWDRIRNVVTAGIPYFQEKAGTMGRETAPSEQILTPQAAMTPVEQHKHPVLSGIGEVVGGVTSPQNVAILAGTGGLGELPGAIGIVPRLISAGFSGQMIYGAAKQIPDIRKALQQGDYSTAENLLTKVVLQGGLAALGAHHAMTGVGLITGRDVPVSDDSAIGRVVSSDEKPTDVSIVPTESDKLDVEKSHTIQSPEVQTADGDTVPAARIVSEDHIPTLSQNDILSDTIQRIIHNSGEMQKAGIDPSKIESPDDVKKMLNEASAHIQDNLDPRVGSRITLDAQKKLAADLGMERDDLLSRQPGQAMNAEQAIAARSMLMASQKNVLDLAKKASTDPEFTELALKALAQHKEIGDVVRGITSEAGRALGSFRVGDEDLPQLKLTKALSELPDDAKAQAIKDLSKIDPTNAKQLNQFVQQITPSSTADKIFEYYRNALLSSPHTAILKGVSESAMMALDAATKMTRGIFDPNHFASEAYWYSHGALQALQHSGDVLSGNFNLEGMPDFEKTRQEAIKGGIGKVIRFPSGVLSRQTNLMYVLNYFGELNAQAARQALSEGLNGDEFRARQAHLASNPTTEMQEAAHQTALHNTFQNGLGKFGLSTQRAISSAPGDLGKFLFPFFKTPMNLIKAAGEYSPYGIFKAGVGGKDFLGMGENMTPDQRATLAVRGSVGSAILGGLATQVLDGKITGGGPLDYKKRLTLESTGWQPYSIKIGNKYFSYHRAEPIGLLLGAVADAIHGMQNGKNADDPEVQGKADTALAHVMRNVDDLPFLTTLASLSESLHGDPGTKIERFLAREIGGFIPAGLADVAHIDDPVYRNSQTIEQTLEARTPGLTKFVPPEVDVVGRTESRPSSGLGGANPFPISTDKGNKILDELTKLGMSTPQPLTSIKIGNGTFELTPGESERLQIGDGRILENAMLTAMSDPSWEAAPTVRKKRFVEAVRRGILKSHAARFSRIRLAQQNSKSVQRLPPLPNGYVLSNP